jgi:hypothetical protein
LTGAAASATAAAVAHKQEEGKDKQHKKEVAV